MSLSGADAKSNSSLNYLAIYSENEFHRVANEGGGCLFSVGEPTISSPRQGQLHFAAHSDICLTLKWQIKAR